MIDQTKLEEALDIVNNGTRPEDLDLWPYPTTPLEVIEEAARLVADPDTLVLHGKDGTAIRTDIEMVVNRWCPSLNDYAVSQAAKDILDVLESHVLLEGTDG